ncbi:MAG: PIG-L deacetylase family protein, partial [Candidatus Levyibacteriota bacterium]
MKGKVILAVGAHPDDTDFGASGTIARWISEGASAYYVVATDGSRGSVDPKMTHKRLAAIRRSEQEQAAKAIGVKKVFFLNHPDTQLLSDLKLKEELVKIIRLVKPNIVITMDPTFYYSQEFINHSDHRAVALAAMDAVFPLARDRLTFPEHEKQGLRPHRVEEILFSNFREGSYVVDITKTLEKKIKALSSHKSQFDNFPEVEKRVRERAKMAGKKSGYKAAEAFNRVKIS